jgi:DNA polymerase V
LAGTSESESSVLIERIMKSDSTIAAIHGFEQKGRVVCPLFSSGVSAGFPSPAEDHIDHRLDLNELLIHNPAATFFVRVAGDSMTGSGINHGDILVVDRSLPAAHDKIVIAVIHGELTVKRLVQRDLAWHLVAANAAYPSVVITEENGCEVWGVVTSVIRRF